MCYDWGFPCTASPDKMHHSSGPLDSHHRGPLRSSSPATFSNVRVHVRAIWRITGWQLQAWLSWKVRSLNGSPQMLTNLWNAEHCEVWINSCWHHLSPWTTPGCADRSEHTHIFFLFLFLLSFLFITVLLAFNLPLFCKFGKIFISQWNKTRYISQETVVGFFGLMESLNLHSCEENNTLFIA